MAFSHSIGKQRFGASGVVFLIFDRVTIFLETKLQGTFKFGILAIGLRLR